MISCINVCLRCVVCLVQSGLNLLLYSNSPTSNESSSDSHVSQQGPGGVSSSVDIRPNKSSAPAGVSSSGDIRPNKSISSTSTAGCHPTMPHGTTTSFSDRIWSPRSGTTTGGTNGQRRTTLGYTAGRYSNDFSRDERQKSEKSATMPLSDASQLGEFYRIELGNDRHRSSQFTFRQRDEYMREASRQEQPRIRYGSIYSSTADQQPTSDHQPYGDGRHILQSHVSPHECAWKGRSLSPPDRAPPPPPKCRRDSHSPPSVSSSQIRRSSPPGRGSSQGHTSSYSAATAAAQVRQSRHSSPFRTNNQGVGLQEGANGGGSRLPDANRKNSGLMPPHRDANIVEHAKISYRTHVGVKPASHHEPRLNTQVSILFYAL